MLLFVLIVSLSTEDSMMRYHYLYAKETCGFAADISAMRTGIKYRILYIIQFYCNFIIILFTILQISQSLTVSISCLYRPYVVQLEQRRGFKK